MASLNTIKNWFKTGLKPTQSQFWETWDSFWHKSETIPASAIENLEERFDEKVDDDAFQAHLTDENAHDIAARLEEKVGVQQLQEETEARVNSDSGLQDQIDAILDLLPNIKTEIPFTGSTSEIDWQTDIVPDGDMTFAQKHGNRTPMFIGEYDQGDGSYTSFMPNISFTRNGDGTLNIVSFTEIFGTITII